MSSSEKSRVDRVFNEPDGAGQEIQPSEFNETVAHVFDDMANRSIPAYQQVETMTADLAATFYRPGTAIYDLGCSTCTESILLLERIRTSRGHLPGDLEIQALDNSLPMCREAREKVAAYTANVPESEGKIRVQHADILETEIHNASVVIMNYTLQFIPPLERETLIKRILNGLCRNGVLLVSDKTLQSHTDVSRIFIDHYYNYKRLNGYSELEISRKREALENVLVPYHIKEEEQLFYSCGFDTVDIYFSWYNFTSFLCVKRHD